MKKSLVLLAIAMLSVCTWLKSCQEADKYVRPTVSGLIIEPNPCAPGDTVKASLTYAVAGDCWYWYSQTFKIPEGCEKTAEYRGTCNDPSFVYFIAPKEAGTYTVTFKGQITITSGNDLWGDAYDFEQTFRVQE